MRFSDPYGILSLIALEGPPQEDGEIEASQNIEQYIWPLIIQSSEPLSRRSHLSEY
jgi:hypothetical protein